MTIKLPVIGEARETIVVEALHRTQIVQYAGASGDYNPLHTDETFALARGQPTVIAHGMLTMGLASRVLMDWFGVENIVALGSRFLVSVRPGDTVTARVTVKAVEPAGDGHLVQLDILAKNQKNESVLSGYGSVRLRG